MEQTYFRKGFGLKTQVQPIIDAEYRPRLVDRIRVRGYADVFGDVTIRLAQEFGFCYGVDRAIDYAYETVRKFPGRRTCLVGEIIHNTGHLASMCRDHTVTCRIADAACIHTGTGAVRHKPELDPHATEAVARDRLPEGTLRTRHDGGRRDPEQQDWRDADTPSRDPRRTPRCRRSNRIGGGVPRGPDRFPSREAIG